MDNNASYRLSNLDIDVPFQNGVFHSGLYRFSNNFPLSPPFYVGISPSDTQAKMEFWDTVSCSPQKIVPCIWEQTIFVWRFLCMSEHWTRDRYMNNIWTKFSKFSAKFFFTNFWQSCLYIRNAGSTTTHSCHFLLVILPSCSRSCLDWTVIGRLDGCQKRQTRLGTPNSVTRGLPIGKK